MENSSKIKPGNNPKKASRPLSWYLWRLVALPLFIVFWGALFMYLSLD